ncbi:MAG: hypothetical protein KAS72_07125 [Phycisphaerales bacterium]|nr:hypothetical protein [Phycisphaerales bacterium]
MTARFVLAAALGVASGICASTQASDYDSYFDTGERIALPDIGAGSYATAGDVLSDGRLIAVTGNSVYVESAVGSGLFDILATFDPSQTAGSTDPAFVTVSPFGSRIAVGTGYGKPVAVFGVDALGTPGAPTMLTAGTTADYFAIDHFDATWFDEQNLAITSGQYGSDSVVTLLDTTSNPTSPANPTIVAGIGGSPAGITFDADGMLFTGNGFTGSGPSETGYVKAFPESLWQQGLTGTAPGFEDEGTYIADLLSAASLGFDIEGNLFVGGGDMFASDYGYFALINSDALSDALAGIDLIDIDDPADVRRFDPEGSAVVGSYAVRFNEITGELYGGWADGYAPGAHVTWAVYAIPAPGSAVMMIASLPFVRRRRHA